MSSSRSTLASFTDAAADAVARAIVSIQRDAQRERELREAQFAAFGNLDWRVQLAIVAVVVGFAIYAIQSMPAVRRKLGLA